MKKLKHICMWAALALPLWGLGSCSKEEVSTYDTAQCSLNIWVGTSAGAVYETTTYN